MGLDDKRLYRCFFPLVKQPQTIISKYGNLLLNKSGEVVNVTTAVNECLQFSKIVCKKPINSCGGHSVKQLFLPEDTEKLRRMLCDKEELIIQECVIQHKELESYHPNSVNTIRTITYLRENGESVVLSSVLRMGNKGSFVDNVSSGGCTCGIQENGTLRTIGYSNDMNPITHHPNGLSFKNRVIPSYDKVVQIAKEQHCKFPHFSLLAWDFAIDKNGTPVLIEVNMNNASINFMQLNNGPLFGSYTDEILERVYRNTLVKK